MDEKKADAYWERLTRWAKRALQMAGVVGTVLVAVYFIRIRSVPVDNFSGILGTATLIAAVTGLLFLSMTLTWSLPAMVFRFGAELDRDRVCGWFYGSRRHASNRTASVRRVLLWSGAGVVAPWIALFALFAPDSFGGPDGAIATQAACLVLCAAVFSLYALDRPIHPCRERPRLFRRGTALRVAAMPVTIACALCPLALFSNLVQLSDYEHTSNDLAVLALIVVAAGAAGVANFAAMGHELNNAKKDWQHEAGHVVIPGFVFTALFCALGCSARLQDRVMEISDVRIPHATVLLKEAGCQPLRMAGLLARQDVGTAMTSAPSNRPAAAGSSASSASSPGTPVTAAARVPEGCAVSDVTVLSHIGARWPLACVGADGSFDGARIEVRADDVEEIVTGRISRVRPQPENSVTLCSPVALPIAAPETAVASGVPRKPNAKPSSP